MLLQMFVNKRHIDMHTFLKMQLFTLNIEETRIYFLILRFSLETYILLVWILKDVLDLSSIMKPGAIIR